LFSFSSGKKEPMEDNRAPFSLKMQNGPKFNSNKGETLAFSTSNKLQINKIAFTLPVL
jgi:hypothetical protein